MKKKKSRRKNKILTKKKPLLQKGGADFDRSGVLLDPTTLSTEPRDLLPPSPVMLIPPNTVAEGTGLDGTISLELQKQKTVYREKIEMKETLFTILQVIIKSKGICVEEHEHTADCLLGDKVISRLYQKFKYEHHPLIHPEGIDIDIRKESSNIEKLEAKLVYEMGTGDTELGIDNFGKYLDLINFDTETLSKVRKIEYAKKGKTLQSDKISLIMCLIETIIMNREVVYLCDIINFIEIYHDKVSLASKKREELYFYYGDRPDSGKYIGTLIEEVCYKEPMTGKANFIKQKPRDVILLDYNYQDLMGNEKTQLLVYSSSGSNFSASQKNLLTPINGNCLSTMDRRKLTYPKNEKFKELFSKIDSYLFMENDNPTLFMNTSGEFVPGTKSWDTIIQDKKFHYLWIMKFVPRMIMNDKFQFSFYDPYKNWPNKNYVYKNILGQDYYMAQLKDGKVAKIGNAYIFKNVRSAMKTIEFENLKKLPHPPDRMKLAIEHKKIFYRRFFMNRHFYSYRNMDFDFRQKQVSEYQINAETKDQNIYGYNLDDQPYTGFSQDNKDDMKKVRKRIISYFYDTIFYAEYKKPDKTPEESLNFTIEEIKDIVLKSNFSKLGENEISPVDLDSFDIKYNGTYYDTDQVTILKKIISILEKEAIKIIEDGSKQYLKNTKFNTFIRMPLYEDIQTHYRTK
jgi:hypothetical protein